jgi:hypothetical protein
LVTEYRPGTFWLDCWAGNSPFCVLFPRLFAISTQKEASVIDYWVEGEGWGVGTWGWRRRLFEWEENLLIELLEVREEEDEWSWELEDNGTFAYGGSLFGAPVVESAPVFCAGVFGVCNLLLLSVCSLRRWGIFCFLS